LVVVINNRSLQFQVKSTVWCQFIQGDIDDSVRIIHMEIRRQIMKLRSPHLINPYITLLNRSPMKKKNFVSLSVALAFLSLGISGLLLYIGKKPKPVETIHVIFGLTFLGFAIFHIMNNWGSITGYLRDARTGKIKTEFTVALIGCVVFLLGAGFMLPPFEPISEAGKALFRGGRGERAQRIQFEIQSTNQESDGTPLTIILQKNREVDLPIIAVWIEDSTHQFVENIFVPAQVATPEEEDIQEAIAEGEIEFHDLDPKLLPAWSAKAKLQTSNFSKATPFDSFVLNSKTKAIGAYTVLVEVNSNGKTELYEALIQSNTGNAFKLKSPNGTFLDRALVEIN